MAATLCGRLVPRPGAGWLPLAHSVRHGSKAVTRHRKPMHILKQKLLAVTEYIPPKPSAPPEVFSPRTREAEQESGLVVFLKRDLEALFRDHKMIAVAQNNASNAEDTLILKQRLLRHDIRVKFFPVKVVRSFLENTPYRNMKPLFIGHTVLFVSKEPKAKEMLATLKGSPQMVLLGGCIENTLLSVQGIVDYSRLPSHATIQGQLVSGLTAMTSRTASMLQHHPSHLSALLQQYVKQQSAGAAAGVVAPQSTSVPEGAA